MPPYPLNPVLNLALRHIFPTRTLILFYLLFTLRIPLFCSLPLHLIPSRFNGI
jgi:hypothetical protein